MPKKEKFKKLSDEEMIEVKSSGNENDPSAPEYYDDENPGPEGPDIK